MFGLVVPETELEVTIKAWRSLVLDPTPCSFLRLTLIPSPVVLHFSLGRDLNGLQQMLMTVLLTRSTMDAIQVPRIPILGTDWAFPLFCGSHALMVESYFEESSQSWALMNDRAVNAF